VTRQRGLHVQPIAVRALLESPFRQKAPAGSRGVVNPAGGISWILRGTECLSFEYAGFFVSGFGVDAWRRVISGVG
jgi:hypothetical protein